MTMSKIVMIPTPQTWGSVSMQRYFEVLWRESQEMPNMDLDVKPFVPYLGLTTPRASRFSRAWELYGAYPMRAFFGGRVDVVHHLAHGTGHLNPLFRGNPATVATVHDLIPLTPGGGLSKSQVRRARVRFGFLRSCDALVAVSKHTSKQIQEFLEVPSERIQVIPNGVDHAWFEKERPFPDGVPLESKGRYVLSVSNTHPRKNLRVLPEVFSAMKSEVDEPIVLVRAGAPLDAALRHELIKILGEGNVIELGKVSDEVLAALYRHAGVFLFLSLQEGFGLPLLEAMTAGCPVVSSNTTSLPEVGGDAVLYADPHAPEEAARQLGCALGAERERLVADGRRHVQSFTWKRHFEDLVEIYQRLSRSRSQIF